MTRFRVAERSPVALPSPNAIGVPNYIRTSDGPTAATSDLAGEYERLRQATRTRSRRERSEP